MPERIEDRCGPYLIIGGVLKDVPQAIAYLGGQVVTKEEAEDPETAVRCLKERLADEQSRLLAAREDGVPSAEEYASALASLFPKVEQQTLEQVRHHVRVPGGRLTMRDLSRVTGQIPDEVQKTHASIGRALGRLLQFDPKPPRIERPALPIAVIAEPSGSLTPFEREWTLREQARQGLAAALDLVPPES
ncbi:hypothetical protein [Lutibaculum baratangense]|uniref:Uncharacterized protein n=1 Tax=Lutibaculum baratangense AMV1 TaxID=631454 RepID=V4R0E8_9HYPH|nr:hypothetical protein [Lutibaculum baratangense]ESR25442.1 hypothetical protein N177_1737 [Lutibaculum baratangense AMV1]